MLEPFEIEALLLSFKVAVTATLVGLPFAIWAAYLLSRRQFAGKFIVETLVHIPLVVPPVVVGFALLVLFTPISGFGGWLSGLGLNPAFTWVAAAIASGVMAFPLMVRSIRQAFDAEPQAYGEVAQTLGIDGLAKFFRISLPLAAPGLISAAVLGFARAIGEFGATITFAANIPGLTQTLPLALYTAAQSPGGEVAAYRLALISLVPAIGSLLIAEWLQRKPQREDG
jgi:molybdate transport system permease protein